MTTPDLGAALDAVMGNVSIHAINSRYCTDGENKGLDDLGSEPGCSILENIVSGSALPLNQFDRRKHAAVFGEHSVDSVHVSIIAGCRSALHRGSLRRRS